LILIYITLLAHSPANFIFFLGRLIFSESINSHPDSIYIYVHCRKLYNLFVCPLETSIKLSVLLAFLSCFAAVVTAFCIFWQSIFIYPAMSPPPPPQKNKINNIQLLNCRKRTETSAYGATVFYGSSTWIRYQKNYILNSDLIIWNIFQLMQFEWIEPVQDKQSLCVALLTLYWVPVIFSITMCLLSHTEYFILG